MPVETEKYTDLIYEAIASVCQTHGCKKRIVYGIKADIVGADEVGETTEIFKVKDISTDKNDVMRLIMLLNEYAVTKEHVMDVIEDFVQELYA